MTTVKLTSTEIGNLPAVIVNGRQTLVKRISEIAQTRPGHFEGKANGQRFHIEGGRAAGGSSRDWFVSWDGVWDGYINANSLTDAINLIERA